MSAPNSSTDSPVQSGSSVRSYPPVSHLGDPVLAEAMRSSTETPSTETTFTGEAAAVGPASHFLRLVTLVDDGDSLTRDGDTKAQVLDELESIIEVQQETLARLECLYQTIREL
ncbi:hypothetical protein GII30_01275 [Gordonia amarae]|uniref:Uncharacterized protein n=2 Tax=Gordonia amarae TaxID=36821 RepID=G7GRV0_9ACTN|nr:hypothetical protein [Gordonia amarae]MCS3876977.1 hypothetical protein [Gordonia amarae]QHN15798.1 hypothetical protein GII35_01275 [Gordonia amarae]QHN20366.1 hypothetical protein GII34_01275 [Gordonia amarae]QHN29218.1 hypothetical protein GII32_01280 [Gordonia amarae]QHN37997.1 hypothetical protein GII30_01275 [Gordonia amarae]